MEVKMRRPVAYLMNVRNWILLGAILTIPHAHAAESMQASAAEGPAVTLESFFGTYEGQLTPTTISEHHEVKKRGYLAVEKPASGEEKGRIVCWVFDPQTLEIMPSLIIPFDLDVIEAYLQNGNHTILESGIRETHVNLIFQEVEELLNSSTICRFKFHNGTLVSFHIHSCRSAEPHETLYRLKVAQVEKK
jgi:hypothetical protein